MVVIKDMQSKQEPILVSEADKIYTDGTYFEKNPTWHIEDSAWKANQIQKILSQNKIKPKSICEIGCGAGEILKQLSYALPNSDFYGYEISPQAYALCKTRETEKVLYRNRNLLHEEISFDALLCIDDIEEEIAGAYDSIDDEEDDAITPSYGGIVYSSYHYLTESGFESRVNKKLTDAQKDFTYRLVEDSDFVTFYTQQLTQCAL